MPLPTTSVKFNTPHLTVIATLMQDLRAKCGKTNKLSFLRFVRMTFVHGVHILRSVTRSELQVCQLIIGKPIQCVKADNWFWSKPSSASTACVRTQPSPEIRAYPSDPSSRCRSLFHVNRQDAISQCPLGYSLHIACVFFFLSLFFSRHGHSL